MIVLAFDPGSTSTGWARVDARGGGTLPVSVTFLDGGNVPSRLREVDELLHADPVPELVAVEKIEGFAFGAGKGPGVVSGLVASSSVAGGIAWLARSRDLRVAELSARQWRHLVCGQPSATDARIKNVLERIVHGFPKRSNAHVRDAMGLGVGVAWHTRCGRSV